jgi:polyferredoxin
MNIVIWCFDGCGVVVCRTQVLDQQYCMHDLRCVPFCDSSHVSMTKDLQVILES